MGLLLVLKKIVSIFFWKGIIPRNLRWLILSRYLFLGGNVRSLKMIFGILSLPEAILFQQ